MPQPTLTRRAGSQEPAGPTAIEQAADLLDLWTLDRLAALEESIQDDLNSRRPTQPLPLLDANLAEVRARAACLVALGKLAEARERLAEEEQR